MSRVIRRRHALGVRATPLATSFTAWTAPLHAAEPPPREMRLDYATDSPTSLVLKQFGWLGEDLKRDGIAVKWVLSAGSHRARQWTLANTRFALGRVGSAAARAA